MLGVSGHCLGEGRQQNSRKNAEPARRDSRGQGLSLRPPFRIRKLGSPNRIGQSIEQKGFVFGKSAARFQKTDGKLRAQSLVLSWISPLPGKNRTLKFRVRENRSEEHTSELQSRL